MIKNLSQINVLRIFHPVPICSPLHDFLVGLLMTEIFGGLYGFLGLSPSCLSAPAPPKAEAEAKALRAKGAERHPQPQREEGHPPSSSPRPRTQPSILGGGPQRTPRTAVPSSRSPAHWWAVEKAEGQQAPDCIGCGQLCDSGQGWRPHQAWGREESCV